MSRTKGTGNALKRRITHGMQRIMLWRRVFNYPIFAHNYTFWYICFDIVARKIGREN